MSQPLIPEADNGGMRQEPRGEREKLAAAMRAAAAYRPDPGQAPVVLSLPFTGSWLAANSPARRIPSHGTHFLGQTFAIDFVAVDTRRRTATVRDWRTVLSVEPVDRFLGFGGSSKLSGVRGWSRPECEGLAAHR